MQGPKSEIRSNIWYHPLLPLFSSDLAFVLVGRKFLDSPNALVTYMSSLLLNRYESKKGNCPRLIWTNICHILHQPDLCLCKGNYLLHLLAQKMYFAGKVHMICGIELLRVFRVATSNLLGYFCANIREAHFSARILCRKSA